MDITKGVFISIPCPSCGYAVDVELLSVRLQERVFCSCCKIRIQLIDDDATVFVVQEKIDAGFEELKKTVEKLNTTITIKI